MRQPCGTTTEVLHIPVGIPHQCDGLRMRAESASVSEFDYRLVLEKKLLEDEEIVARNGTV